MRKKLLLALMPMVSLLLASALADEPFNLNTGSEAVPRLCDKPPFETLAHIAKDALSVAEENIFEQNLKREFPDGIIWQSCELGHGEGMLTVLQNGDEVLAVISEFAADGSVTTLSKGGLFPEDAKYEDSLWIQDKWDDLSPYIWYGDRTEDAFDITLEKNDGIWQVTAGLFGGGEDFVAFYLDNAGTALCIRGDTLYPQMYIPIEIDLDFTEFDIDEARELCKRIVERPNDPYMIPSTMQENALPQGKVVSLLTDEPVSVRSGPGEGYGASERDVDDVSEAEWIQAFGRENGWVFIRYFIPQQGERFGYVPQEALEDAESIPELKFLPYSVRFDGELTNEPLWRCEPFGEGSFDGASVLATMGREWFYVEVESQDGLKYRGFCMSYALEIEQ